MHARIHARLAALRQPLGRRWAAVALSGTLIAAALAIGRGGDGETAWSTLMLAATLVAGAGIAVRAVRALAVRDIGIELLVTIAVVGAIVIGELWEAAAVTFLFTFGAALETLTISRTRGALRQLLAIAPVTATVLRGGERIEVDPADVELGEPVLVMPGGKIPVDGVVDEGSAAVDESSITGESLPREAVAGGRVFAGSVLRAGSIVVRATGVGADTTLARIIHRVEEAQEAKAPAQRLMERFARWYTPGVVALAAGAYAVSGDLELALTLLVIACPGALVISMPVSIVAGIGRAARRGILVKGGEHLEAAGRVDAIALDKTGTLTRGRPMLSDVAVIDSASDADEVLGWAAGAEAGSEHPLAAPILAAARAAGLDVPLRAEAFEAHVGRGVSATVDGERVVVGTLRLMDDLAVEVGRLAVERAEQMAAAGLTAALVARGGRVVGVVGIGDEVRPEAAAAVSALRAAGVKRVVMLTGDSERVARAVAERVGIDEVHAELLPEDKLERIAALREQGHVVAMVGDGVNDAPALAAADVGIAMGAAGTDVAIETADITLMSDRLPRIAEAIELSRSTVGNLRQNVGVALVTVAVLLAGVLAGQVHMAGGMLVHQASVILVVLNAMRLLRGRRADGDDERAETATYDAVIEPEPGELEAAWAGASAAR
ncbi:MAG: cation-translocating P-type ATPase [Solirubrobacteraceae bacterium]|nr:cation-translocating P-type ATPase [Solirubrobacteraceae bacterium]